MEPNPIYVPRNLGGVVAQLVKTPDGGLEVVAWDSGSWKPANFAVGDVMMAPPASDRLMAELGIPAED